MRSAARKLAACVVIATPIVVSVLAQQRDTNKPPTAVPTAGQISGVVQSPEGQPVRRAVVTLTGDVPVPRSVLSDDSGAFTFPSLPAGTFSVTARKAAHLAAPYGAMRPGRSGTAIVIAAGQRSAITITMFKGAAITGVVRGDYFWGHGEDAFNKAARMKSTGSYVVFVPKAPESLSSPVPPPVEPADDGKLAAEQPN